MDRCIKYSRQDLKAIYAKTNASTYYNGRHNQDVGEILARIPLEILASNKEEQDGRAIPGYDDGEDLPPESRPRLHSYGRDELLDIRQASPTENSPLEQRLSTLGLLHQIGGHPDDHHDEQIAEHEQKVNRRMLGPSRHHNATMKP